MKKNKKIAYLDGGEIGSLVGRGLGLAAGALIPGAQPFLPALTSLGASAGSAVGKLFDKPTMQSQMQYGNPSFTSIYSGGIPYGYRPYKDGGKVKSNTVINVEGKELQVNNGKVISDYALKPPHPINGGLDPKGFTVASAGNTIIPADKRKQYIYGDMFKRRKIEKEVVKSAKNKEKAKFAEGGTVPDYIDYNIPRELNIDDYGMPKRPDPLTPKYPKLGTNLGYYDRTIRPEFLPYNTDYNDFSRDSLAGNIATYAAPFVDNIGNFFITRNTPNIPDPILTNNIALNNELDVRPQLQDIEASRRAVTEDIARRTNSPSIYRASASNLYQTSQAQKAKVFNEANQYRNQIDNQQRLFNNQIEARNNQLLNQFNYNKMVRKDDINRRYSANLADFGMDVQGINRDRRLAKNDLLRLALLNSLYDSKGVLTRANLPI